MRGIGQVTRLPDTNASGQRAWCPWRPRGAVAFADCRPRWSPYGAYYLRPPVVLPPTPMVGRWQRGRDTTLGLFINACGLTAWVGVGNTPLHTTALPYRLTMYDLPGGAGVARSAPSGDKHPKHSPRSDLRVLPAHIHPAARSPPGTACVCPHPTSCEARGRATLTRFRLSSRRFTRHNGEKCRAS